MTSPDERLPDLRLLRDLDLASIAITAELGEDGRLHAVGGGFEKLLAAVHAASTSRIHTLVVAEDQALADGRLQRDPLNPRVLRYPDDRLHVLRAPDLATAVDLLAVDAQRRWGEIIDYATELRKHQHVVGRRWLRDRVRAFVARRSAAGDDLPGGYLLLTGGPFFGKSAFVADQVRDRPTVVHFVRRGEGDWDKPDVMLRSLAAQLRRKHVLPRAVGRDSAPAQAFRAVLDEIARGLEPGEREVIYIDGLDELAGLDETLAAGSGGRLRLDDVLPRTLPPGIAIVLTSRPGEHLLDWHPERAERVDLDAVAREDQGAVRADIRAYIGRENRRRGLGLDDGLIDRLVDATEGYFGLAVLYLRPELAADREQWRADPAGIPHGPTGWLIAEWGRVMRRAEEQPGLKSRAVEVVLGLLATAREPLSLNHLDALLRAAEDQRVGRFPLHDPDLHDHLRVVLRLGRGFFYSVEPGAGARSRYRFFHSTFREFILDKLSHHDRRDLHRALDVACARWQDYDDPDAADLRAYAAAHRADHERASGGATATRPRRRRRRRLAVAGVAGLLVLAVALWLLGQGNDAPGALAGPRVELRAVAGEVRIDPADGAPQLLEPGQTAALDSGARAAVLGQGRAETTWEGVLQGVLLTDGDQTVADATEVATPTLRQTAGTVRYRLPERGSALQVAAGGVPLRLAAGESDGGADVMVSFDPEDPRTLWLGVLDGVVEIEGRERRQRVEALQAAFVRAGSPPPTPMDVHLAAPQACFDGVDRGRLPAVSRPAAVCCLVPDGGPLRRSPGGRIYDALDSGALVSATGQLPDESWLRVSPVDGGPDGWLPAAPVLCTGPVPHLQWTPSPTPSATHTASPTPTASPTDVPTRRPTGTPTARPTASPTAPPTSAPQPPDEGDAPPDEPPDAGGGAPPAPEPTDEPSIGYPGP